MDTETFLKETEFCDFSHPRIVQQANVFKKKYSDDRERAVAIFYFVRDTITYTVGDWRYKASETLERRSGSCTNNANLMVALLRAVGTQAAYGLLKVKAQQYFGPVVPRYLARNISESSIHVYVGVYLSGKWIKADPTDDELLSKNSSHLNPESALVDWDGTSDAILIRNARHIIEDRYPLEDIEFLFKKKLRGFKRIPVRIGNYFIQFLREEGASFKTIGSIQRAFPRWLSKKSFLDYTVYNVFFGLQDLFFTVNDREMSDRRTL